MCSMRFRTTLSALILVAFFAAYLIGACIIYYNAACWLDAASETDLGEQYIAPPVKQINPLTI